MGDRSVRCTWDDVDELVRLGKDHRGVSQGSFMAEFERDLSGRRRQRLGSDALIFALSPPLKTNAQRTRRTRKPSELSPRRLTGFVTLQDAQGRGILTQGRRRETRSARSESDLLSD